MGLNRTSVLVIGALAGLSAILLAGCVSEDSADEDVGYSDLEAEYRECFGQYIEENGADWVVDTMTGMYITADTADEMYRLRNFCETVLECPPAEHLNFVLGESNECDDRG